MENTGADKENVEMAGGIPRLQTEDLEQVVESIVRALRSGKPAHLPGLGTLNPGREWTFLPEPSRKP